MSLSIEQQENVKQAFIESYMKTHSDLRKKPDLDAKFSGTTAVSVLIRGNLCFCANTGDSRAIIGRLTRNGWLAVPLSEDHKPENPEERIRIEASNGRIEPYKDQAGNPLGPARVWLANEQIPGLAMSRSIGDLVAQQVGVTSMPDVTLRQLDSSDKFIVIASDGIWEFISNEECVNIVSNYYFTGKLSAACEQLANIAVYRWNREDDNVDDITVVVACIKVKEDSREL